MGSVLKKKVYRNPKLLKLAADCPCCMNPACGVPNEGNIVACHSNKQRHGKGMGIKAHDITVYICESCHAKLDGRIYGWDMLQKEQVWAETLYQTMLWLFQSGKAKV